LTSATGPLRRANAEARLLAHAPAARRLLAAAILAGFLAAVTVVAGAWLMSLVIAGVFLDGRPPEAIGPLLAGLVLLAAARALFLFLSEILAQRAANRLKQRLRTDLTGRLFSLGPAWTSRERSGELSSVFVNGLDALDAYMTAFQPARWLAALVPIFVLLVVFVVDPLTTLVLLFTGPVLLLLLALIGSRTRAVSERRFAELRWMSAYFLDMLQGIGTLKMFGRSAEQVDNMRAISSRYGDTTMEVLRTAFQTGLVLDWGGAVAMALVAVQISLRLMADAIPFDRALAVLIITPEFFLPLRQLAVRYHAGTAGRAVAGRVMAILDEPAAASGAAASPAGAYPAVARTASPAPPPGDIVFDGVSVRFPGRGEPALDRISLTIPVGRRLAVIGETGAGKSTLVSLLMRFIEPDAGSIRVGDTSLVDIDVGDWRRSVAWVPQAPHLFHGTIADNLRLARPDATPAQLEDAVRAAGASEFIEALPEGFETQVGEGAIRLSGGQRQRLAIARALLRDAPLLILDEPTAHLDPDAEDAIAATIGELAGTRTVLVVSHRLRLAQSSELLAVLDRGRLVEVGTPADLVQAGGAYAGLVSAALRDGWRREPATVGPVR
jgi:thiol reductant ABC exporter CydD subunit